MQPLQGIDVMIVGAGPAGTAAAIYAAQAGLRVVLLDQYSSPKPRPGESLPSGIEIIFRQLGVWHEIMAMDFVRYAGHFTCKGQHQEKIFHPYGHDLTGPWQGFQIPRDQLDLILQKRAQALGVTFFPQCHVKKIQCINKKIILSASLPHDFTASFYLDATGSRHLFAKNLNIPLIPYSHQLIARYGYLKKNCPHKDLPLYIQDKKTWTWYAKITAETYAWVNIKRRKEHQCEDIHLASGGADVTWRMAKQVAGPTFFLLGDAACVLDPSSGHGVLRALMTGMMTAFIIANIKKKQITEEQGHAYYHHWLNQWFKSDVEALQDLHLIYFRNSGI